MFKKLAPFAFSVLVMCVAIPPRANAQINSNTASVVLSAPLVETLTIAAAPSTVTFVLVGSGTSTGSTAVSVTTAWVLAVTRSSVKLYGYFASASAALTDGASHNIPTSAVLGSVNSGAFTAFTGNSPFGTGTSLQIFSQAVSGATLNSNRTDSLALEIDTVGLNLPSATYTGTLTLQAQAI